MKVYYDLHIHSCLSPCGDDDATPAVIAGIAKLNGLDMAALTDHNTCKNCPAFFTACEFYGVTPVAGMELTTAEDVHIVCLFPTLEKAMEFDGIVEGRSAPIKNKPVIFGNQNVMNEDDEVIGSVENLLIAATSISIDEAVKIVSDLGGVAYPAHIDRDSNGIIAVLGDIPKESGFTCAEMRDVALFDEYKEKYPILNNLKIVSSSDAHGIGDVSGKVNFIEIEQNTAVALLENLLTKK